ncbi:MAG: hypothetical protein SPG13_04560 [Peptostreptococcus porci]|uniref:hypothetical protein n=1 Tax=Peptostreptococcus porci TaxID=2652282 RepID=UPI002A74C2D6|nr:hypothetical protein [Peptostreptococcus porci]MDY2794010.1 hypothetical protein [Peptostreptococcus porci]MDY5479714.1 hypothetical protein [Peptostreptococcus porci]
MKKINKKSFFLLLSIFLISGYLTGCAEEVYQDQRMNTGSNKENEIEYSIYNNGLLNSGYNWYSEFLGDFLIAIKDNNYKVSEKVVSNQIDKIEIKIEEIKNIKVSKVIEQMEFNKDELSKKDKNDKAYFERVKNNEKNIESNMQNMVEILSNIKTGLELGKDGQYDENDLKQIKEIQKKTIEIFDNEIIMQS